MMGMASPQLRAAAERRAHATKVELQG